MDNNEPYFFNPGLSSDQIEDWLNQQLRHVANYNKLKDERTDLIKRLSEIDVALEHYDNSFSSGKLRFSWYPNTIHRRSKDNRNFRNCATYLLSGY